MQILLAVLCVVGAVVGAGFASGREIVSFFTRYGAFSWVCAVVAAVAMMLLIDAILRRSRQGITGLLPEGRLKVPAMLLLMLLYIITGGGMVAAGGELWALTVPLHSAYTLGMVCTLGLGLLSMRYGMKPLSYLGWALVPLMLAAFVLCMGLPSAKEGGAPPVLGFAQNATGIIGALCYAGFNITLALGVLCDVGQDCSPRKGCRTAAWAGGALGALLLLANAAFLPHLATVDNAALPTVLLLREYGLTGFYLSAAMLYLAILTTLLAVMQGLYSLLQSRTRHPGCIMTVALLIVALGGFERIVSVAYPALGALCFVLLCVAFVSRKPKV